MCDVAVDPRGGEPTTLSLFVVAGVHDRSISLDYDGRNHVRLVINEGSLALPTRWYDVPSAGWFTVSLRADTARDRFVVESDLFDDEAVPAERVARATGST